MILGNYCNPKKENNVIKLSSSLANCPMTASNWGIIDVDWTLDATGNKLKFDRIPDWQRGAALGKTGNIDPEDYFPEILLTCSQGNFLILN